MVVFVTTEGDIGMCYGTMNHGRPGVDASSPVVKADDHVVCIYGAGSPIIVWKSVGDLAEYFCLHLPCMFMRDCECYVGQPHPIEAFKRMTFV